MTDFYPKGDFLDWHVREVFKPDTGHAFLSL